MEEIGISLVNICSFFHKDGWLDFERLVVKTVVVGPVNMTKLTVPLELNAEDKDEGEHIPDSIQLPYFKSSFFLKVEITTNTGTEERIFPRHFAINLPIEMVSRVLVLLEAKRLDGIVTFVPSSIGDSDSETISDSCSDSDRDIACETAGDIGSDSGDSDRDIASEIVGDIGSSGDSGSDDSDRDISCITISKNSIWGL